VIQNPSFAARRCLLHIPSAAGAALAVILFLGAPAAFSSNEADKTDGADLADLADDPQPSPKSGRETGLAYIDLPMDFRARFDATYTNLLYMSDRLARPYTANFGPNPHSDYSLESSIALTRSISNRVEIGIMWGGRSPIANVAVFDFDRQSVRAMVRIVR
jgi:hypothetical protein